jgi:ESCRT-II complex subunit VPS36
MQSKVVQLTFAKGQADVVHRALTTSIQQMAATTAAVAPRVSAVPAGVIPIYGASAAAATAPAAATDAVEDSRPLLGGLARIEHDAKIKQEMQTQQVKVAFSDLDTLMKKAGEMAELAKQISTKLRTKKAATSSADAPVPEDEADAQEFADMLAELGLDVEQLAVPATSDAWSVGTNAVTAARSDRTPAYLAPADEARNASPFHRQIALQVAKLMEEPIARKGGMMSLTDAYCLVNRARGTDLVSPEDLLRACTLLTSPGDMRTTGPAPLFGTH